MRTISLHELVETFFRYNTLEPRTEHCIKKAFQLLAECVPNSDTSTFGKKSLFLFQNFLTGKYDRNYCNRLVNCIRRVFKWATLVDLVTSAMSYELSLIPPLRQGDRRCRENKKRTDVPDQHIKAVKPYLKPMYADMLGLQEMTGMRPSEVCNIKAGEINTQWDGVNWLYQPEIHKTAGKNIARAFILPKQCQEILAKYLSCNATEPVFKNLHGKAVSPNEYSRKIKRTIDRHQLQKFVPYQVRHTAGTRISREFSRDYARAFLGHTTEQMTRRYDHADLDKLRKIAERQNAKAKETAAESSAPTILRIYTGERGDV